VFLVAKKRCKICKYFGKGYGRLRIAEKQIFEKKCYENVSFRELSKYLEYSCQLKVSHNLVRNHIKHCMPREVELQREAEKEIQKSKKSLKNRVKGFFFKSSEEVRLECKHHNTFSWFEFGQVWTKCTDCNEILGKCDPQEKSRNSREKTLILLEALMR
jgi:hypothetical protein